MKKQQGFTLIELMIVVAIIGILAAVAIPQYQSYIGRSQASEAVTLLSGLKTPVLEYYSVNGKFPVVSSDAKKTELNNLALSGQYVASISGPGGAGSGVYTATFKGKDISAKLFNQTLQFTIKSTGEIECKTVSKTFDKGLLPSTCK